MTTAAPERPQKKIEENKKEEKSISSNEYGCEILLEKTTIEKSKDASFPNDAYLIWYVVNEETYIDLTRSGKRSDLFDFYYDMYGPGAVQKIDFGYGRISPRLWGYQKTEKRKRK
jgi:hypothetical protein